MSIEKLKYEKLGDTEIIVNTLPSKEIEEAYHWETDRHIFTINVEDNNESFIKIFVSPSLTSIPPLGISAIVMRAMKDANYKEEIKVKDTYIQLITLDTYLIETSDKENLDLLSQIVILSINNFNSILEKHPTSFRIDRDYKLPPYEEILEDIKNQLRLVK